MGMSIRAYARHLGVTHRAVQRALASGRIVAEPDGSIDADRADAAWKANTRHRSDTSWSPAFRQARTIQAAWTARFARLEFEQRSGRLVDVEQVSREVFEAARRVRDLVLAVPDRLAPVIAAETNAARVHALITAELQRAVDELDVGRLR